jgi:hypothetical protein
VILREQLGIGRLATNLVRSYVDDLYRVVISDGYQHEFPVLGQFDAARSLADLDSLHDGEFVGIDYTDGVALLVRDIGGEGARLGADEDEHAHGEQPIARPGEVETSSPRKKPAAGLLRHRLFEPALTFGTVDPERIQFGNLMQKSFLRRDRNDHSAVAQKDGLTKLKIPVAQRQPLAFERGQGEIESCEEIRHDFRVG